MKNFINIYIYVLLMLPYLEMSILISEALNTFKNKLDQAIALDLVNNSNHFFFFFEKEMVLKTNCKTLYDSGAVGIGVLEK